MTGSNPSNMDSDFRTCESVLTSIEKMVRGKEIIDSHTWVNAAEYLNILQGDEQDRLLDLQQVVSKAKVAYIESGASVALAKAKVEATDDYKEMMRQKGKMERIQEAIRIAKIHARLADTAYRQ